MGPLLVRCLLSLVFTDPLDVNAGATVEARAGQSPIVANGESTAFVAGVLTPEGSLDVREPQTTLRLRYFPRLFWQKASGFDARARPLVLHQASLALATKPSSRTQLSAQVFATIGEPDYAALPQFLPTGQAVLPVVTNVASIAAAVNGQADLSRRWKLLLALNASHFRPLGDQTPTPTPITPNGIIGIPLTKSTSLSAVPGTVFQATSLDSLVLTVAATYGRYEIGAVGPNPRVSMLFPVEIFALNPMLTWRRRLDVASELRLGAGLGYATYLEKAPTTGSPPAIIPTGAAELITRLLTADQSALTSDVRASFDEYVDPVLGISGPRLLTTARLVYQTSADWSAALQAEFSTTWATVGPTVARPDLTFAGVSLPVRYRISNHLILEGGARLAGRAPSVSVDGWSDHFHQRQTWGYVLLTVTTRNEPPFAAR